MRKDGAFGMRTMFDEWKIYSMMTACGPPSYFYAPERRFASLRPPAPLNGGHEEKKTSSRRTPNKSAGKRYVAYRFRGKPDEEQSRLLSSFCGSTRWIWNRWVSDYREGKPFLRPAQIKKEDGHDWLRDVDAQALCNAQLDFERAMSEHAKGEKGSPRFHKKHERADSYTTNRISGSENVDLRGNFLKLPKIEKPIRLIPHRKIEEGGILKSATVTREPDGRWYFSLLFEYGAKPDAEFSDALEKFFETGDAEGLSRVGLDMSLPDFFVASDGSLPEYELAGGTVKFEKQFRKYEKRIAREQRKLSHMKKDSANYSERLRKIARLHAKAKHARRDFQNQLAVRLARKYDVVSIEDLDMSAMKKALKFGKSVSDLGWGRFVRILERKLEAEGHVLIRVSRWFPSSKTCRSCGFVHKELRLSDRTFVCPKCGNAVGRDVQAAGNVNDEGLRLLEEIRRKKTA